MQLKYGIALIVAGLLCLFAIGFAFQDRIVAFLLSPQEPPSDVAIGITDETETEGGEERPAIEIVAEDLSIPWSIAFLPSGDLLVTERPGTLLRIGEREAVYEIEGVHHVGEGGLLGVALHPDFIRNHYVYLYLTTRRGNGTINRVERYTLSDDTLSGRAVILDDIPGASYHDGGRIAFGPDGMLYITTGDAGQSVLAQDTSSLAGKILRVRADGSIPSDNPFENAVYSYGHRNPQGLAWDADGHLWSTEHGPSGTQSGNDELNLIVKGGNYGWPELKGEQESGTMRGAVAESGDNYTWAPASAVYLDGRIFFGGLRGAALYEATLSNLEAARITAHLLDTYGRIRDVVVGPDGALYLTTSNTDGRGNPRAGDDRIIRVDIALLR